MNLSPEPPQPLRERLTDLLQTLRTWPWLDTLAVLRKRFREDHLGLSASSLTFTTTLALVPLATVMLALFTAFPIFGTFKAALERYFIQSLVPETIAKPVLGALTTFALKANRLGILSLLAVVVTALALMLTIDRTLNDIWRVRTPRPIAQRVLVYWAALTLGPLLLGMSLSLPTYLLAASRGFVRQTDDGLSLFFDLLQSVLLAGGMAALYRYVPNTPVRWRQAWAGGIFVAIGFELAKSGFAWYLHVAPFYSTIYGAFAAVPIFLLWIYACWVIVLLGAVIVAYAPSLSMRIVHRPPSAGHRFEFALALLRLLAAERGGPERGLSAEGLATALRADPLQVEPVLDALVRLDWVARLDEGENARHVLLVDPVQTLAQPLLAALLLEPSPVVAPFWRQAGFERLTLQSLLVDER